MARDVVHWFADKMEKELRNNDHKVGWKNCTFPHLLKRLRQEVGELERAVKAAAKGEDHGKIIEEAADVGNFAMMIADLANRYGEPEPEEAR